MSRLPTAVSDIPTVGSSLQACTRLPLAGHLYVYVYVHVHVHDVRARWPYGFTRFLLYFSGSLFTAVLWGALPALFRLQHLGVPVLLPL
ncbi:Transmembrane protein 250 [Camelus dromedarius]|uniref:Transmembrane protein 250 n=1 Tax=Camelus dromedarius TaxID=9838 RepID=A0A5N4EBI9_CAMDR|nr:Transmembrane protein 250 [Camelus dromedarius]